MAKKAAKEEKREVVVPIIWETEGGAPTLFANQMMVQVDEHECHLSFFEIRPPLIIGTDEEKKAQAEALKSVAARCVARVVISKNRLPIFLGAVMEAMTKSAAAEQPANERGTNGKDTSK